MNNISEKQYISIEQIGSTIGRNKKQKLILLGLGLKKIGQQTTIEDSSSTRGMIAMVNHLVRVL